MAGDGHTEKLRLLLTWKKNLPRMIWIVIFSGCRSFFVAQPRKKNEHSRPSFDLNCLSRKSGDEA